MVLDASVAVDAERRVPAVISSEYPVVRDGYIEILQHLPACVDLSRSPLPLVEQHAHNQLNVGIVDNLRVVDRTLRGDVVLGRSARADELWLDIVGGVVRSLSVGYAVHAFREAPDAVVQVTRWQPFEVSLVSVPADPNAGLYRSLPMPQPSDNQSDTNQANEQVRQAERTRVIEINGVSDQFRSRLPGVEAIANTAISEGITVAEFRTRVMNSMADADDAAGGRLNRAPDGYFGGTLEGGGSREFIAAASDALLLRSGIRVAQPHPAARDMRGLSVLDLARTCVSRSGRTYTGDSPELVVRAALSTSDFPALLGDTLGKALRQGVENEAATHRQWCVVTEAPDFRTQSRVILGSAPDLLQVEELGEYTNGALAEDKSTLVPGKFGRIVSLSWESILADNLGAFIGLGRSLGQACMRVEADSIYAALISNALNGPTLADTLALFDASRNNTVSIVTGTGKPLTAAALGAARAKLRRQKNTGGGLLNLAPRTLIVPPERETEAEMLVAAGTVHHGAAATESQTPAWISGLTVVADPRLVDLDTFYLVADPNTIGTAEIVVVGSEPTIEEIEEPKRDVLSWKARHAFAAGFVDFRGVVKGTLSAA